MIFILSFAVFGASGVARKFPSVRSIGCSSPPRLMGSSFYSGLEILHMGTWITAPKQMNDGYCAVP